MISEPAAIDHEEEAVPVPPQATMAPSRSAGPSHQQLISEMIQRLTPVGVVGGQGSSIAAFTGGSTSHSFAVYRPGVYISMGIGDAGSSQEG